MAKLGSYVSQSRSMKVTRGQGQKQSTVTPAKKPKSVPTNKTIYDTASSKGSKPPYRSS